MRCLIVKKAKHHHVENGLEKVLALGFALITSSNIVSVGFEHGGHAESSQDS